MCAQLPVDSISTPQGRPVDGDFIVELSGLNYYPDVTVVTINGSACANVSVSSDGTAVACYAPPGAGTSLVASVASRVASLDWLSACQALCSPVRRLRSADSYSRLTVSLSPFSVRSACRDPRVGIAHGRGK